MNKAVAAFAFGLLILSSVPAHAGEGQRPPLPAASPEFERIKSLAGTWEGTATEMKKEGEPQTGIIEYEITSGGAAVVERLFKGTPHEMVSIYYDRGGKLTMTHYCMLGNRPELALAAGSSPDDIRLEHAAGSDGIDEASEMHMHGLTLAFADADHFTQTWTSWENGQPMPACTVIALARKK